MTVTFRLKSRVTRKCHARFGTGRAVGDRRPDQNWVRLNRSILMPFEFKQTLKLGNDR
jgi:hypothetical protein